MKEDDKRKVMEAFLLVVGAQYVKENYREGDSEEDRKKAEEKVKQLMMSAMRLAEDYLRNLPEEPGEPEGTKK